MKNVKTYTVYSLIFLVFSLPMFTSNHYLPLPQFWSEFTVALIVCILFAIIIICNNKIIIPIQIIPVLILIGLTVVQIFSINQSLPSAEYFAFYELILCIIVVISFSTLITRYSKEDVFNVICWSLLISSIFQSLYGFIQYFNLFSNLNFIFRDRLHANNIFGTFGQRNHYCHYLTWGVFSAIYLFIKEKIKLLYFLIVILLLIFSLTIASSRSVFLYFFVASLLSMIYSFKNKDKMFLKTFYIIILVSLFLIMFEFILPLVDSFFHHSSFLNSGLYRISSDIQNNSIAGRRLIEWKKALIIFLNHPFLGIGWENYGYQSFLLQKQFSYAPLNNSVFSNCHNLLLQLLAETGLIGAICFLVYLIYCISLIIKSNKFEDLYILILSFVSLTHSMVEYPLWYLYFLLPFVIYLSLNNGLCIKLNIKNFYVSAIYIVCALFFFVNLCNKYLSLMNLYSPPATYDNYAKDSQYIKNLIDNDNLVSFVALIVYNNYININQLNTKKFLSLQQQLYYTDLLYYKLPYSFITLRRVKLLWELGKFNEAKLTAYNMIVAYPQYKTKYITEFSNKKYLPIVTIINNFKYKSN